MKNFTSNISNCSLLETNRDSKLVVYGTDLYLIGESEQNYSFVKISESSKSFKVLPSISDKRSGFCVCSFMQKIIVIGGNINEETINSCFAYDTKTNKLTYIASMNESRKDTSCTIFQGKSVVTGGLKVKTCLHSGNKIPCLLKSVEAYCFYENKWTKLSDMLQGKSGHRTVIVGNKIVVIARYFINGCEVYDSVTSKFTSIKTILCLKTLTVIRQKGSTVRLKLSVRLLLVIKYIFL